jgi:hypothetical protein
MSTSYPAETGLWSAVDDMIVTTNFLTAVLVLATALLHYRYCVSSRVLLRYYSYRQPWQNLFWRWRYDAKRLYCEFTKTDLRKF